MISFSQHLTEDKGGKNLHLEHIELEHRLINIISYK